MPDQQWITFYESVQNWPEAKAVASIKCPKLLVYGGDSMTTTGGVTVSYGATNRERRKELEALGWRVAEIPSKVTASDSILRPSCRSSASFSTRRHEPAEEAAAH